MNARAAKWRELEEILTNLLHEIGASFDDRDRALVADFIANNEFEVALNWIESIVASRALSLSDGAQSAIARAKALMVFLRRSQP